MRKEARERRKQKAAELTITKELSPIRKSKRLHSPKIDFSDLKVLSVMFSGKRSDAIHKEVIIDKTSREYRKVKYVDDVLQITRMKFRKAFCNLAIRERTRRIGVLLKEILAACIDKKQAKTNRIFFYNRILRILCNEKLKKIDAKDTFNRKNVFHGL